jgi:hypothetical protein
MEEPIPDEVRAWGPVLTAVRRGRAKAWFNAIMLGVGIVFMWGAVLFFMTVEPPRAAVRKPDAVRPETLAKITAVFAALGTLFAAWFFWYLYRTRDTRVLALQRGIVSITGGKLQCTPYDQISEVQILRVPTWSGDLRNESGWTRSYVVQTKSGGRINIDGNHFTLVELMRLEEVLHGETQALTSPPPWNYSG